jgi:hypothetical protein
MKANLAETKAKITQFDVRFNAIERQQGDNALTQTARFDKLEQLIGVLANAIASPPPNPPPLPSPHYSTVIKLFRKTPSAPTTEARSQLTSKTTPSAADITA